MRKEVRYQFTRPLRSEYISNNSRSFNDIFHCPDRCYKKKNYEFYIHAREKMSSKMTLPSSLLFPARLRNHEMEFSFCTFTRRFSSLIRDALSTRSIFRAVARLKLNLAQCADVIFSLEFSTSRAE